MFLVARLSSPAETAPTSAMLEVSCLWGIVHQIPIERWSLDGNPVCRPAPAGSGPAPPAHTEHR